MEIVRGGFGLTLCRLNGNVGISCLGAPQLRDLVTREIGEMKQMGVSLTQCELLKEQ
jgi:hypothetical protein